jgi:two-component system cell cycle response regulator
MAGTAVIVDRVPTNCIILKVKLTAAFYRVVQAETGVAALSVIEAQKPDIVLLSYNLLDVEATQLCAQIKSLEQPGWKPVVVFSHADNLQGRLAALQAGTDDVLTRPMETNLMLARLRSLLRARDVEQELGLRDSTTWALGFAEPAKQFTPAGVVTLVCNHSSASKSLLALLEKTRQHSFEHIAPNSIMQETASGSRTYVYILDLSAMDPQRGLSLLSNLKSHAQTRLAATFVLLPNAHQDLAAHVLDLGADDLMIGSIESTELRIRLNALVSRKRASDQLRNNIRDGLKAAITDPLTGLFNRRYAMPHMERVLKQAYANDRNCAIMVLDMDHLKRIDDHYGHLAGDAVLIEVSQRLESNLRSVDLIARMGSEEFLMIMPETKHHQAEITGQRLCGLINKTPISLPSGQGDVTVSIGIVLGGASSGPKKTATQLLDLADRALYGSKSDGRNRVTFIDHAA